MPKYAAQVYETITRLRFYTVEADDLEDAEIKASDGDTIDEFEPVYPEEEIHSRHLATPVEEIEE